MLGALFTHRNVSTAARALGVTQPSVSLALRRLRAQFGDDLFIRQGGEMTPTLVAERLREPVARVLATVQSDIIPTSAFDPETSERSFTLGLSDLGELSFLPDLIGALRIRAPHINVRSVTLSTPDLKEAFADGTVDLALGYFMDFAGEHLFSQKLFDQSFTCLVAKDHPTIGASMSMEQFLSADHAIVEQDGRSQELFERRLRELGHHRRIVLRSPHFMSVPLLISQSDLITTVPAAVARIYTRLTNLKMVPLPFESPTVELRQFWHRRSRSDAGNVWLRRLVAELFRGRDPTSGEQSPFWAAFHARHS